MSARASDGLAWLAACTAALLCACAHTQGDVHERLARYRAQAGSPVAGFDYVRNLRWEALGDQAIVVWPQRASGFLVEMASPCPGLDEARSIQITHGDGRVRARIGGVGVLSLPGSPPMRPAACPILLIKPIAQATAVADDQLRPVADDDAP